VSDLQWFPLHRHDAFSLLDSIANPKDAAKRCLELGLPGCAITDHGSVSGAAGFRKEMGKHGLKAPLGCEIYLSRQHSTIKNAENRPLSHLVVLSKNLAGWKDLLRLVSRSNDKDHFYYSPRQSLDELRDFTAGGNLIAFSGHPGSDLGNVIFKDYRAAYKSTSYEEIRDNHIHADAPERMLRMIEQYVSVFGRENFFLEVQVLDPDAFPAARAIAKAVRWASKKTGIPCVATADTHYIRREDAADQRILLCSKLRTTLNQVRRKLDQDEEVDLGGFFKGDSFHLPSVEEMRLHHTDDEIRQSMVIAEMIEDYDILSNPKIPKFPGIDGWTQEGYLRELCRKGWDRLIADADLSHPIETYEARLEQELKIFEEAGLSSYFLIVSDFMNWCKSQGWWCGRARGSAGGSLVAWLTNITEIDPIYYDLMIERFYNEGRNTPGHISMPDIDCDVPQHARKPCVRYLQGKYGHDRVGKIATFGTMQGKSAIDEVFAAHEVGFDVRKQITQFFPDKARISEELEEMGENASIIRWTLDNFRDDLSEWATMNDDGSIEGEFAPYFEQAIRLEGVKRTRGTHAAGVVISDGPLCDIAPLRYDEADDCWIADMEYPQLESMGLMKLDVLGVAMLDKCEGVRNLALTGRL